MLSESSGIYYSPALIQLCESEFRGWHRSRFSLTRKPDKRLVRQFYCEIDLAGCASGSLEDRYNSARPLPVVPFVPSISGTDQFYFGVRLRFDHAIDTNYLLTSAGITIFFGSQLSPMVRAEWDSRDIGNSRHAQPHWHLIGTPYDKSADNIQTSPASKVVDFLDDSSTPALTGHIHFPIAAQWHENPLTSIQHQFRELHLKNWIAGLVTYLHEQLQYAAPKKTNAPVDFPA